jgi:AraC-like DNA-binding protein
LRFFTDLDATIRRRFMLYLTTDLSSPIEYCTSGIFSCAEGGAVHPARLLSTYVVLFGREGEYRISQNNCEYILTPGSFLILLAGFHHRGTAPCSPGLSHYWCHFYIHSECDLIDDAKAENAMEKLRENSRRKNAELNTLSHRSGLRSNASLILPEFGKVKNYERINRLFDDLIETSHSSNLYRNTVCDLITTQILCELSSSYQLGKLSDLGTHQRLIAVNVINYIHANAASVGTVAQTAELFNYNPEYLTTIIRQYSGLSLLDHIHRAKIEEAQKLLMYTDFQISEIVEMIGMTDQRYFSRFFKKITGMTPTGYRNSYNRGGIDKSNEKQNN